MEQEYKKLKLFVRAWMQGRGYHTAVKAMNFAETKHVGTRKDGAPEFSHQVTQAAYAITLIDLFIYPEEVLSTIFLHDIHEDCDVTKEELIRLFGVVIAEATIRISKVRNGIRIPDEIYYKDMEPCPIVGPAKGIDRLHNIMTMLGGFTPEKQVSYVEETETKTIPLLKVGRLLFPEQAAVYENIKLILQVQLRLYKALNAGVAKPNKKK
jgi:(p)ppGpp synthase/HD superfamily hydrolase